MGRFSETCLGKQVGVFGSVWLTAKLRLADRPARASWPRVYGVSLLCGIGFTMSLFIGLLAFPDSAELQDATKIGVLLGSLVSALAGWTVLRVARPEPLARRASETGREGPNRAVKVPAGGP